MSDVTTNYSPVSAAGAIIPAFNHTIRVLFRPFNFVKWLKFGLVCLIINLVQSGINFWADLFLDTSRKQETASRIPDTINLFQEHLVLAVIVGLIILLVILTIWTILIYLQCRFSFVFLDGVIKNDLQIKKSYKENRVNGWSYFLWAVTFTPALLLIILLLTGIPATLLIVRGVNNGFSTGIILGLAAAGLFFFLLLFILIIIGLFTYDFVLPIMRRFNVRILAGWKIFWVLLKTHKADFLIYLLLKIGLGYASMIILIIPCCLISCVMIPLAGLMMGLALLCMLYPWLWLIAVPVAFLGWAVSSYFWQLIALPVTIFFRSYSLTFLEGFGHEFVAIKSVQ